MTSLDGIEFDCQGDGSAERNSEDGGRSTLGEAKWKALFLFCSVFLFVFQVMGWKEEWGEAAREGRTVLELYAQKLDDTDAAGIAERLAADTTLKELRLYSNQIRDAGASKIAESLAANSILATLDLDSNEIGAIGASKIAESLATNTSLTKLNLGGNGIGDIGASKVGESLGTNTTLTILDLGGNGIGDVGASKIAESLATSTTLTTLNLYSNEIGDEGASKIAKSLATNSTLTLLTLWSNQIGDAGASKIGESIATNNTITHLYLGWNRIGDVGASKIAEALATNTSLMELRLQHNRIEDFGASKIAESLATNTRLTELRLGSNLIGDVGARKIAESLATNTTLTRLDLDYNKFVEVGLRVLARSQLNQFKPIDFGESTNKLLEPHVTQLKRDQEIWNRLKHDLVPAITCKVILCGRWGAGKTTLRRSLEALGNSLGGGITMRWPATNAVETSNGRTIGMEVARVKCSDGSGNAVMVHDIGGQDEFHVQHDCIMGDEAAIFVILCNLAAETVVDGESVPYDAFDELLHLKYWLGYVLMHNESASKPRVLVVGTRGIGRLAEGSNLMSECVALYSDSLDIHSAMYCMDASLPRSDETMLFWKELQGEVKKKLKGQIIPRLCAKIVENQAKWCKIHGSILRWTQFTDCVAEVMGAVFAEQELMDVCEFLHRHGHVQFYRQDAQLNQFIVLDPTAFSQTIGTLLAPSLLGTNRPGFNAGVCSLKEICSKFPNLTSAEVVKMLDHFELAYELSSETLLFPVHLPPHADISIISVKPRLDLNDGPILLCRRFSSRLDAGRLTHGTFPRFQVRLHRQFKSQLELKEHYAHMSIAAKEVYATLIYHKPEGFVDVAVWGQPSDVFQLVDQLRKLLFEDHMLLLRTHEQAISAQMTFDRVSWPLPVAIPLAELKALEPAALVDLYARTPSHLKAKFGTAHRNERTASLLHGYPAWGTGNQSITLDEFYNKFIDFCQVYRESTH